MPTRRDALTILAVTSVAAAQTSHANHEPEKEEVFVAAQTKVFTDQERPLFARLTDLILPRTDTPGAIDAHVPELLEERAAALPSLLTELRQGVATLPPDFLSQSEAQQIALLKQVETTPFFKTLRDLTVDLYYSTPEGLQQELGWHGNTVLASFPGCTHPEHQA